MAALAGACLPKVPEDYIHRVGRTARAEAVGDAFTFVAPEEEPDLRRIERALGRRLPRVVVPDFDYTAKPAARLEVPLGERIAAIKAKKAEDRARARRRGGAGRPGGHRGPFGGHPGARYRVEEGHRLDSLGRKILFPPPGFVSAASR